MYDHIYDEMVDVGLGCIYNYPRWQDREKDNCDKDTAFGYKATHNLTHPEMCVVVDKVGGNTSQSGNVHISGKLLVCAKGCAHNLLMIIMISYGSILGLIIFVNVFFVSSSFPFANAILYTPFCSLEFPTGHNAVL